MVAQQNAFLTAVAAAGAAGSEAKDQREVKAEVETATKASRPKQFLWMLPWVFQLRVQFSGALFKCVHVLVHANR